MKKTKKKEAPLEQKQLQWIKGDKMGAVEVVKGDEGEWTLFEGGGRIATSLISEFLQDIVGEPLDFSTPTIQSPIKQAAIKSTNSLSPIRTLFDKQKKNDKVKLNLTFPIEVPGKDIYEIISSSFDETEVSTELEKFIKDQISEDLILDSLFESIKQLISTRYKID